MQYADVILPLNLPRTLTYGIPIQWQESLLPGMRVEVTLGKNKIYSGIVLQTHNFRPESYVIKPIRNVIDDTPIVLSQQLQFWQWVSRYYLSTLGEVMNAALPAHLKLMNESLLLWSDQVTEPPIHLNNDTFLVAEALHIRRSLTIAEVRLLLGNKSSIAKVIHELIEQGIAIVTEILEEKYKAKSEPYVFLKPLYENEQELNAVFTTLDKSPKQLHLLMTFFQMRQQSSQVSLAGLLKKAGCSRAQFDILVKKGLLYTEAVPVDRLHVPYGQKEASFALSNEQLAALDDIKSGWQQHNVVLLHGITGSGKTLLYVQLIKEAIKEGKQALLLLPEIALTTQIVARLRSFFGNELGVYHSRFSNNERVEIWNKVKEKKHKVIIGPRSALWLPFRELYCIIVDEEHDTSYKQYEPAPRFHARDAAIYLASIYQAKVLLGSATPSVESIANTQIGKYGYVPLNYRYKNVATPQVEIVSAKNTQAALSSLLTIPLLEQINHALHAGKQIILFQNKRGYAPLLLCAACGYIAHCPHCDVSLTYHKSTDKLHCHYCGIKSPPLKQCPQCGNNKITTRSFGTEKIEEELQRIFPKAATARMDWDSVRGRNSVSKLIDNFARGKIDILVGTQMVVKGLDFDNVGLVGVLSADSILGYPDFRVNERGYQLMEQVSGRAGRADGEGKVIIQAHNVKHPVLHWVKNHDFWSFYNSETDTRKQFGYPPFVRLIKIICRHRNEERARQGIQSLAALLDQIKNIRVNGPAPALVPKVRNYYLQEIWLKLPKDATLLQQIKEKIQSAIITTLQQKGNSSLQIIADIDPY